MYFLTDLSLALLANLLHVDLKVCPYAKDPSFQVSPRFWALPTGDTSAGKSPAFTMLKGMYTSFWLQKADLWPWAECEGQNMHSNGTHGLFNEMMREHGSHVCFAGPEAVNYLSPAYPDTGKCDTSAYVNIPKLLEAATGGEYKWGTAKEAKERRAAVAKAKASARERVSSERPGAASAPTSCAMPAPISFRVTNVNVCWFQQVDVLRDWWVVAEHKRHLGFAGRMVLGFSLDAAVPPGCRRDGGKVLRHLLEQVWQHTLQTCGPKSAQNAAAPCIELQPATATMLSEDIYQEVACVRADRRKLGYGLRAALGKWEYWLCSVAFLNNLIESAYDPRQPTSQISDCAVKCALRFLDQRLLFGSRVLQTEMACKFGTNSEQRGSQQHDADSEAAEVFRAMPAAIIAHTATQSRLAVYRRRQQESSEQVHQRRRAVWERAERLGLGQIRRHARASEAFFKFERSAEVSAAESRCALGILGRRIANLSGTAAAGAFASCATNGGRR